MHATFRRTDGLADKQFGPVMFQESVSSEVTAKEYHYNTIAALVLQWNISKQISHRLSIVYTADGFSQ